MTLLFRFLSLLAVLSVHGLAAQAEVPAPAEALRSFAKGWSLAEGPESYSRDTLWELIDGGAAIFHEYGVVGVASARFTDAKGRSVLVELYAMKDEAGAYGIFSLNARTLKERPLLAEDAAASTDYVLLRKGRFYATLSAVTPGDRSVAPCLELATQLAAALPGSAPGYRRPASPLKTAAVQASPVFLRGSIALLNLYAFAATDPFSMKEGAALDSEAGLFLALPFATGPEALERLGGAWALLSKNPKYRTVVGEGAERVLQDDRGAYLVLRSRGREVLIGIGPSLERLRKAIGD